MPRGKVEAAWKGGGQTGTGELAPSREPWGNRGRGGASNSGGGVGVALAVAAQDSKSQDPGGRKRGRGNTRGRCVLGGARRRSGGQGGKGSEENKV